MGHGIAGDDGSSHWCDTRTVDDRSNPSSDYHAAGASKARSNAIDTGHAWRGPSVG